MKFEIFFRIFVYMIRNLTGEKLEEFKNNFKITGYFAPGLVKLPNGQKYILCIGNPWIPIPDEMTLTDAHERWIKKDFIKQNKVEVKVPASRGKTIYTVSFDTKWKCTCSGFKFKDNCKHVDLVKETLKQKLK